MSIRQPVKNEPCSLSCKMEEAAKLQKICFDLNVFLLIASSEKNFFIFVNCLPQPIWL